MVTFCRFASYKKTEDTYDEAYNSYKITCAKKGKICEHQRPCKDKHKWIISEMARNYCRDFKEF